MSHPAFAKEAEITVSIGPCEARHKSCFPFFSLRGSFHKKNTYNFGSVLIFIEFKKTQI